jgi:hypothetical protein
LSLNVWLEHGATVPAQVPPQTHPADAQALPSVMVAQSGAAPPQVPVPKAQGQVAMVPLHTPDPGDQKQLAALQVVLSARLLQSVAGPAHEPTAALHMHPVTAAHAVVLVKVEHAAMVPAHFVLSAVQRQPLMPVQAVLLALSPQALAVPEQAPTAFVHRHPGSDMQDVLSV